MMPAAADRHQPSGHTALQQAHTLVWKHTEPGHIDFVSIKSTALLTCTSAIAAEALAGASQLRLDPLREHGIRRLYARAHVPRHLAIHALKRVARRAERRGGPLALQQACGLQLHGRRQACRVACQPAPAYGGL